MRLLGWSLENRGKKEATHPLRGDAPLLTNGQTSLGVTDRGPRLDAKNSEAHEPARLERWSAKRFDGLMAYATI
jgi:hypothetical protein